MSKEIRLNAFEMNCPGHLSIGLWRHPQDQSFRYKELSYWLELARTLERGLFDGIFIADVLGIYDVYRGGQTDALREAAQVPVNDPLQLVPAMASVTEHLGFGITASINFEHPYPFARRFSTADHLTRGRIGWNIVTSYLESGARNLGQSGLLTHDNRYDVADEYLEVCYKLWEGSWEDDAVILDRARGIYVNPAKVHEIRHEGRFFNVPGIHLSEPSPQRTPVLYQAGASSRGKTFAATHAECVFVAAPSKKVLRDQVADIRRRVAELGRDPNSILIFNQQTVIVGRDERDAQERLTEYKRYISYDGALTLMSGWTGIDLSQFKPGEELKHIKSNAIQSAVDAFTAADPNRVWTIGEIADYCGIGGDGPLIVGSPQSAADALESWVDETGVDGFNLAYAVRPDTFTDLVDLLVPELQRRGRYKTSYRNGTLREKLFGQAARLASPHPAAGYRRSRVA
ncbi:MAG TPA: LLM class flavin-dependent oxidoreductase [Dongiaceae bacterium]|nr:LLM class flavin-dependent oxidoreductase [Dongiaceae bacterium]